MLNAKKQLDSIYISRAEFRNLLLKLASNPQTADEMHTKYKFVFECWETPAHCISTYLAEIRINYKMW